MGEKGRMEHNFGIDAIRIIAFLQIILIHYLSYAGYYDAPIIDKKMYLLTWGRVLLRGCATLYIMITGFVMAEKGCENHSFRGLKRTLFTYVIVCCVFLALLSVGGGVCGEG